MELVNVVFGFTASYSVMSTGNTQLPERTYAVHGDNVLNSPVVVTLY